MSTSFDEDSGVWELGRATVESSSPRSEMALRGLQCVAGRVDTITEPDDAALRFGGQQGAGKIEGAAEVGVILVGQFRHDGRQGSRLGRW